MKRRMFLAIATVTFAIGGPQAFASGVTDTGTSTLSVNVVAEASFSAAFTGTTLTASDTKFGGFSGTTTFSYKIRTSQSTGTGSITVQVTTFGTGGPALSDLTYGCTDSASIATPCSAGTAVSSSTGTSVDGFGADAHSADPGNNGSVSWTLVDKPTTKTGNYSSTATFTISAA